jgi:hypothetical protein
MNEFERLECRFKVRQLVKDIILLASVIVVVLWILAGVI